MGTQVVVPYREEDEARIFKPMGDLGQIVRMVSSSRALSKSVFLKLLAKGMGFTERKFNSGMPTSFRYCFQSHWKRLRDQVRSLLLPPFPSWPKLSFPRRNFDIRSVNAAGAEKIAKIAAESGVSQFYQLSHLDASANSPSEFYRAKAEGEELVKAAFPTATILRPATMFGYEDKLLNNMAGTEV